MVIKVKYNGEWVKIPYLSSDHGQELVEEAPKDGEQYARQNGVWSVVNIPEVDFTIVWPTLTANKILETCINELWGTDVEAKKLNDYNAALLGILDESYIDIYKDFLQKRKQLKEQVDSDFVAYEQIQEELNSGQITAIT